MFTDTVGPADVL